VKTPGRRSCKSGSAWPTATSTPRPCSLSHRDDAKGFNH